MTLDWELPWHGRTFTAADLSTADAALLQQVTGDGWRSLDPTAGPNHAGNILAVLVAKIEGIPFEVAAVRVGQVPVLVTLHAVLGGSGEPPAPVAAPTQPPSGSATAA